MGAEIWIRKIPVAAGIAAGALCWLAVHASSENVFGTPLAGIVGGFVGNLFLPSHVRVDPEARNVDLFAALFGSVMAAVTLHTVAQGGGL